MKTPIITLVLVMSVCICLSGQNTVAQDKWLGSWKLNPAESKFQTGSPPKSSTLIFAETAEVIKVTNNWVNSVDIPARTEFKAKYDGKAVPIDGLPPGSTATLSRVDAYTLDMIQKSANNVTVSTHYVVSRDLKKLTVNQTVTNADGLRLINILIFEKE